MDKTDEMLKQIGKLQHKMLAQNKYSLLLILQGMIIWQDGDNKRLVKYCNPIGVSIDSFKKPTEEEYAHIFYGGCIIYVRVKEKLRYSSGRIMKIFWFRQSVNIISARCNDLSYVTRLATDSGIQRTYWLMTRATTPIYRLESGATALATSAAPGRLKATRCMTCFTIPTIHRAYASTRLSGLWRQQ